MIHPAAAIFSERSRRAVADGPAFARQTTDGQFVRPDGCCLVGALIREEWPGTFARPDVIPTPLALAHILLDRGVVSAPLGLPEWAIVGDVLDLMDRNDEGYYALGDVLRRDLLGVPAARIPATALPHLPTTGAQVEMRA